MIRKSMVAAIGITMACSGPATAQQDFSKVEIKVEKVAPGVAVLFGAGGNIGLSYGDDGNVLIDDQFAPLSEKILAAVKTLDPDPVSFVINTHWHGDHVGGNEAMGEAGAVIVAHENVRKRMSVDSFSERFKSETKAAPLVARPVVTFTRDAAIHLNGQDIRLIHVANAHTDGDTLVYFPNAKVIHMGDIYFNKVTLPFIDLESGGSIDGMIAATKVGLSLLPVDGKVIPGHGPMATRSDLVAYLAMLEDVRGKVHAEIEGGKSLDEVKAMGIAKAYEIEDGFISADAFVEAIYTSLSENRGAN